MNLFLSLALFSFLKNKKPTQICSRASCLYCITETKQRSEVVSSRGRLEGKKKPGTHWNPTLKADSTSVSIIPLVLCRLVLHGRYRHWHSGNSRPKLSIFGLNHAILFYRVGFSAYGARARSSRGPRIGPLFSDFRHRGPDAWEGEQRGSAEFRHFRSRF
jgi:hypothetical protein